ncbi:peptidoglycan-binding domain-containing protein [Yoonia maritima]|uniref:peptidoglycan-binding domain-containing protein n=1 Tax=Yoonia maritima TaxID=1435347 RepID=UPI000D110806|nr:peptidoglycan-binding domain-containing protein [Yoonia maritima]
MKLIATIAAVSCTVIATSTLAAPCVLSTFDKPLPGATNVEWRHADVPSARAPGVWQEGRIGDYVYWLYPTGDGILAESKRASEWRINFVCDSTIGECAYSNIGNPSDTAQDIAATLGRCLLGDTLTEEDILGPEDVVTPTVEVLPLVENIETSETTSDAQEETFQEVPPPCGLALLPDGPPILTLQRLLDRAGIPPGPLDNIMGPLTREAIRDALGEDAVDWDVEVAVTVLDQQICATMN